MINLRGTVVLFLLVLFVVGCRISSAYPQGHPSHDVALHEKFYSTWQMPDNRAMSCCHNEDCSPAESKFENGQWLARKAGREDWMSVPASKIERERDSPDGRSHLCARGTAIYCFAPGFGG